MKQNQHERILHYLETHPDGISPMDAFRDLHITKLATRIGELIRAGHQIEKRQVVIKNPDGSITRFMRYKAV